MPISTPLFLKVPTPLYSTDKFRAWLGLTTRRHYAARHNKIVYKGFAFIPCLTLNDWPDQQELLYPTSAYAKVLSSDPPLTFTLGDTAAIWGPGFSYGECCYSI
ncbi:hypothetical protein BPAE_0096g00280 [Botrytis paeoniae]|uniref:Uncharacterized protein n=1 Tax=Botrytis paeoniae TaxID=278948 RepID=A0A4Z1FPG1_9HELO|nr:hypothetical protein BPAE_0096g00280 [Botrytis paeoniae]